MLPPVPKLPASDATYTATATSAERVQRVVNVPVPSATPMSENGSNLITRATITSLASEYQLSRSTFILSETLGRLMNLPRQDGEAIETYVARLADALRTMPATQRAALEQQVGKALQGLTLAMLAEVLKNPAGPDAARLALLIELSRYKGLDLATKAVVTSYQQNNRTDLPISQAQPARLPDVQKTGQGGQPNAPVTPQAALGSPANKLVAQVFTQLTQLTAPMKEAVVARMALPDLGAKSDMQDTDRIEQQPKPGKPGVSAELPTRAAQQQQQPAEPAKATPPTARPDTPAKAETRQPQHSAQSHEVAPRSKAEVRIAQNISAGQTALPVKEAETLLFAALTGKGLITPASNERPLPAAAIPILDTPDNQPTEKTGVPVPAAQQPASEQETPAQQAPNQAAAKAASEPELKTVIFEQAASQPLIAAMLAKEGTPLPFVSYPLAKDEPESDTPHRGHPPSSEGEAEEQAEEQGGHDEADERIAANDESEDQTMEDMPDGMNDANAENYYLRMGGIV